jgi:hypothetical protein
MKPHQLGPAIAAKMPTMIITTSTSIRVKPAALCTDERCHWYGFGSAFTLASLERRNSFNATGILMFFSIF